MKHNEIVMGLSAVTRAVEKLGMTLTELTEITKTTTMLNIAAEALNNEVTKSGGSAKETSKQ